jgi:hypothetical protein
MATTGNSFFWLVDFQNLLQKITDDRRRTTDNERWTPSDSKSSHCLWQGKLTSRINTKDKHFGIR